MAASGTRRRQTCVLKRCALLSFLGCAVACSGADFTEQSDAVSAEQGPQDSASPMDVLSPSATPELTAAPPASTPSGVLPPVPADLPDPPDIPQPVAGPCGALRTDLNGNKHNVEVCLTGGSFTMGTDEPNLGSGFADHTPAHPVEIAPFILDAYEVTVARYRPCVLEQSCPTPQQAAGCTYLEENAEGGTNASDLPLTCVTWEQAELFCTWDEGRRLPTEAEWEFAARGQNERSYPWGDSFDCEYAVIGAGTRCPKLSAASPLPVGSAPSGISPEGVYDLTGNAPEWVADWLGSYPRDLEPAVNPKGPSSGAGRLVRGGSWRTSTTSGLGYARTSANPKSTGNWGFRCARDVDRPSAE